MIEKVMVWYFFECVNHLSFSLPLYLKDVSYLKVLKVANVIIVAILVSCVINVSSDDFIFGALNIEGLNH